MKRIILAVALSAALPAFAANPTVAVTNAVDARVTHCIFDLQTVPPAAPLAAGITLPVVAANAVQPMAGNHCQMSLTSLAPGNYSLRAQSKTATETSVGYSNTVTFTIEAPLAAPSGMKVLVQ